jgi:molybdopterin synthase catalytic subunit
MPYKLNHETDIRLVLTQDEIGVAEWASFLRAAEGGAVDLFLGTTRRFTDERETLTLTYEAANELASAELKRLAHEACSMWPIMRLVVIHRLGTVDVSEISVLVGVATAHRAASFEACRFLIDHLKKRVPIWKKERFTDGSAEWVEGVVPD